MFCPTQKAIGLLVIVGCVNHQKFVVAFNDHAIQRHGNSHVPQMRNMPPDAVGHVHELHTAPISGGIKVLRGRCTAVSPEKYDAAKECCGKSLHTSENEWKNTKPLQTLLGAALCVMLRILPRVLIVRSGIFHLDNYRAAVKAGFGKFVVFVQERFLLAAPFHLDFPHRACFIQA